VSLDEPGEEPHSGFEPQRQTKTIVVVVVVVLLVLASSAALIYNSDSTGPKVASPVKVTVVSAQTLPSVSYDIVIVVEFQVSNTSPNAVVFNGMLYQLFGNGENLDQGFIAQHYSVPSQGHVVFNNTFTAELSDNGIDTPTKPTDVAWNMQGTLDLMTTSGNQTAPYTVDFET
jgi:hypothetical protein